MKELKMLVIHCTDTPADREVTGEDIRRWHTLPKPKGRGWRQVGYSDLIRLDGIIENLVFYDDDHFVDPEEITNGAAGYNSCSRHVAYAGGVTKKMVPADTRNLCQQIAMEMYVKDFLQKYPTACVAGHNQLSSKACPSFDVPGWLRGIGIKEENIYKNQTK